jgi:predicted butyrate kinase (DUF1464 family)
MTTWNNLAKTGEQGQGWVAGQVGITAGAILDPVSGNKVFAGFIGQSAIWSNIAKTISLLIILSI